MTNYIIRVYIRTSENCRFTVDATYDFTLDSRGEAAARKYILRNIPSLQATISNPAQDATVAKVIDADSGRVAMLDDQDVDWCAFSFENTFDADKDALCRRMSQSVLGRVFDPCEYGSF